MIGGSDQDGDRFFDTLGKENITLHNTAASGVTDDIFYGAFNVDEGPAYPPFKADGHFFTGVLPVINTDSTSSHFGDFLTGTVYNSHGATGLNKVTTVNNFVTGSNGDQIHFQDGSWADTWYSSGGGVAGSALRLPSNWSRAISIPSRITVPSSLIPATGRLRHRCRGTQASSSTSSRPTPMPVRF